MIRPELVNPIQLNTITIDGNSRSFRIPLKILVNGHPHTLTALLDTGAQLNFINSKLASKLGINTQKIMKPILVSNADGTLNTQGSVTKRTRLNIMHPHALSTMFYLTHIPKDDIILGLPWFKQAKPRIDWGNDAITINKITISTRMEQEKKRNLPPPEKLNVPKEYMPYADIFSEKEIQTYPPARPYDHQIKTKPSFVPKIFPTYNTPYHQRPILRELINDLLSKGFIKPSDSPMASPLFFVSKKDGTLRPIQDYRYLNEHTIRDGFPIPNTQTLLNQLHGSKYFTTLDIRQGYHNIRIKEEDQWKAAFRCEEGYYQPTVMFFGLCNSPATFQRFMNDILAKQINANKCIVYMDDIMIHAATLEQLISNTLEVFEVLKKHKLYLKPVKCRFHQLEVPFLGYIISESQIKTDPTKIQGIVDWPTPKNLRDIRSFTGFTNFYRRFIPNYATICRPLDQLKRKNIPFVWTERQQAAFQALKDLFSKQPLLMQPDPSKPFYLETDASAVATGAVLRQLDKDNQLRPIGYISQALNQTQRNWQIYDRELFAIIRALQIWRHYLLGSPHIITVHCDHKNLTYWRQPQRLTPRQARWQNELSRYPLQIQAIPGKHMIQSDALSRRADQFKTEGELNNEVTLLPKEVFI